MSFYSKKKAVISAKCKKNRRLQVVDWLKEDID